MNLRSILAPSRIAMLDVANSSDDLLDEMARLLDGEAGRSDDIAASLHQRERMGSTAIGHGVALPHGRNEVFDEARAAFVRLRAPIAFGAMDDEGVDLVLALSVPAHITHQHLQLLAEIAERFSDEGFRAALRGAEDADALARLLTEA